MVDETQRLICFYSDELSYRNTTANSLGTPNESTCAFSPDDNGSGIWNEEVGPDSAHSFPSGVMQFAAGASACNESIAYHLHGFIDNNTSPKANINVGDRISAPGLLIFSFDSPKLNMNSDGGNVLWQYRKARAPKIGVMLISPGFVVNSVRLIMGEDRSSFHKITPYDKQTRTWHYQVASGNILISSIVLFYCCSRWQ